MKRLRKDLTFKLEKSGDFDKEEWAVLSAKCIYKDPLAELFDEFWQKLTEFEENYTENEENETILEQLHETRLIAKNRLAVRKTKIFIKAEMEERERQRKIEMEEKEMRLK